MPVTSSPFHRMRPVSGTSSPAISRISVVLPANVGPRSTFMLPASSVRSVGWICVSPATRFETFSRTKVIACLSSVLLRRRRFAAGLVRGAYPPLQLGDLLGIHPQTQLGPPPDHVLGRPREFACHQPPDLALGQGRAEIATQIAGRLRPAQHLASLGAIGSHQPSRPTL